MNIVFLLKFATIVCVANSIIANDDDDNSNNNNDDDWRKDFTTVEKTVVMSIDSLIEYYIFNGKYEMAKTHLEKFGTVDSIFKIIMKTDVEKLKKFKSLIFFVSHYTSSTALRCKFLEKIYEKFKQDFENRKHKWILSLLAYEIFDKLCYNQKAITIGLYEIY